MKSIILLTFMLMLLFLIQYHKNIEKFRNINQIYLDKINKLSKKFNKKINTIEIKSQVNCFGFPHFVHTMEYFYYFSEIIISNPSSLVVVVEPEQEYKSKFVEGYFQKLLVNYHNFIFTNPKLINDYQPNEKQEFAHNKLQEYTNFKYQDKIFNDKILTWFQKKSTSEIIRKMFFPKNENISKIKIGIINRKNNRILLNEKEISKKIFEEFNIITDTTIFEDKSFMSQISFFNEHNIIISPHGAQLCSIPFARENSLIIECCHEEWHPYDYFPGLSLTSSKIHVMMCDNHSVFPKAYSPEYKNKKKKRNIKTDVNKIIKVIRSYINNELNSQQVYLM